MACTIGDRVISLFDFYLELPEFSVPFVILGLAVLKELKISQSSVVDEPVALKYSDRNLDVDDLDFMLEFLGRERERERETKTDAGDNRLSFFFHPYNPTLQLYYQPHQ